MVSGLSGLLFDQQDVQLSGDFAECLDQFGVIVGVDMDTAAIASQLAHGGLIGTCAEGDGMNGYIHLSCLWDNIGRVNAGVVVSVGHNDHRAQGKWPGLWVTEGGQSNLHTTPDGGHAAGAQLCHAAIDGLQVGRHGDLFGGVRVIGGHGAAFVLRGLFQLVDEDSYRVDQAAPAISDAHGA